MRSTENLQTGTFMDTGLAFDLQHQQFAWVTDIYISNPFLAYIENRHASQPHLPPIYDVMSADTALMSSLDYFNPTKLTSYESIASISIHPDKPLFATKRMSDLALAKTQVKGEWHWLNQDNITENFTTSWQHIFPLYTPFLDVIERVSHCWLLFANPLDNETGDKWEIGAEPLFLGYADEVTLDNLESGMGALSPVLGNLAKLVTENNVSVVPPNHNGNQVRFSVPLAFIEIPPARLIHENLG